MFVITIEMYSIRVRSQRLRKILSAFSELKVAILNLMVAGSGGSSKSAGPSFRGANRTQPPKKGECQVLFWDVIAARTFNR